SATDTLSLHDALPISENLVKNGSFESVNGSGWANNWNTWAASGTPQFIVDHTQSYDGTQSLAIKASQTSRGAITQRIPIPEHARSEEHTSELQSREKL